MSHRPLVQQLASILFNGTMAIFASDGSSLFHPEFIPPEEPLELSLQGSSLSGSSSPRGSPTEEGSLSGAGIAAAAVSSQAIVDVGREQTRFTREPSREG